MRASWPGNASYRAIQACSIKSKLPSYSIRRSRNSNRQLACTYAKRNNVDPTPAAPKISSRSELQPQQQQQQQQQRSLKVLKEQYTVTALAFLGDAVWSMHVRQHYLLPPKHSTKYHNAVDKHSAAEMQAAYFDRLLDSRGMSTTTGHSSCEGHNADADVGCYILNANEQAAVQWAFSEPVHYRLRFQGQEEAQLAYQKATALEALIGYLALTDGARLGRLMAVLLGFLPAP